MAAEKEITMETKLPAVVAVLLAVGGTANAKPVCFDQLTVPATRITLTTRHRPRPVASNPLTKENPTGLPAYEMRPDGLMLNGLLPGNGWQG
jgi:hypothetical protein